MPRGEICFDVQKPKSSTPQNFLLADIHHIPFRTDSFEMVTAHNVLEHIVRPDIAVQEMLRVGYRACFTQDKLWSLGALSCSDHLWVQLPGFKFTRFPRTRLGLQIGVLIRKILTNRPFNIVFRQKYRGSLHKWLVEPHSTYFVGRNPL